MTAAEDDLTTLTERSIAGLRIQPVALQAEQRYINIMIYGDTGVGKTVLAGSASVVEDMSPVLLIDIEGGTLSLEQTYPNVEAVPVKSWRKMQEVYDELYRGGTGYKTVIIDSLTETQKFSMSTIMSDLIASEPGRDPDIPSQREWGKSIEQIRRLVRGFRDLPMNTIFTALQQQDKDPRSGMLLTKPSLPGKLAGEVPGFLDIVVYYYMKMVDSEQKRFILTAKTDKEVAKDRSGRLPMVLDAPTMERIYGYIRGRATE